MSFPSKSGCPMCGIVAKAAHSAPNSPALFAPPSRIQRRTPDAAVTGAGAAPEILWRDDNFTVYRERAHPVSSRAHLVIVFNLHVPSLYMLSASDVPLLVSLRALAHRFLSALATPLSPAPSPTGNARPLPPSSSGSSSATLAPDSPPFSRSSSAGSNANAYSTPPSNTYATHTPPRSATPNAGAAVPLALDPTQSAFRVGFITPPWKDNAIPVKDHLHAHAYIAPNDLCGWWRGVAYGPLAWYAVEDLIAEIREETSNNRIKSGYANRGTAPLDRVPGAGARSGTADGLETTEQGLALDHASTLESGLQSPSPAALRTPSHLDLSAALVRGAAGGMSRGLSASSSGSGSRPVSQLLSP